MSFLGVPHLHPIILPLVTCPFWGGLPHWLVPGPFWGYPSPRQVEMGYPPVRDGYPPGQVRMREYPKIKMGYPLPVCQGWGTAPPLDRTTEGVLATRWAVCLLRSRRRTFLFVWKYGHWVVSVFVFAKFKSSRTRVIVNHVAISFREHRDDIEPHPPRLVVTARVPSYQSSVPVTPVLLWKYRGQR